MTKPKSNVQEKEINISRPNAFTIRSPSGIHKTMEESHESLDLNIQAETHQGDGVNDVAMDDESHTQQQVYLRSQVKHGPDIQGGENTQDMEDFVDATDSEDELEEDDHYSEMQMEDEEGQEEAIEI